MKKFIVVLAVVIIAAGLGGCGSGRGEKRIDIRGEITGVTLSDDGNVRGILVEGRIEQDTAYDRAMVGIEKGTKTIDWSGKSIEAGDLKKGMKVEAIFKGPVAESYPVQAKAKVIRVTG